MIIYNGVYSWDGKKHGGRDPIAWFPGAYFLKVFDRGPERPGVTRLKQYLCIYAETGQGHSISGQPEKFAKHVCVDFSLTLERVLWVEQRPEETPDLLVTQFSRNGRLGADIFYQSIQREASLAERNIVACALKSLSSTPVSEKSRERQSST